MAKKLTKNQKTGLLVLGVLLAGAVSVAALRAAQAQGALTGEGAPARGDGRAMFRDGDHIIVAAPAVTEAENALLAEVVTLLQQKAPGIEWIPVALKPDPSTSRIDLAPIAERVAALPANIGKDREGVLLLWTAGIKATAQGAIDTSGQESIVLVEVPQIGQVTDEEKVYIESIRTDAHRVFGLRSSQPRQPPGPYVDALLADLRNPEGLPADRRV